MWDTNIKINFGAIIACIICAIVLAVTKDVILKYIAFASLIYLISKGA